MPACNVYRSGKKAETYLYLADGLSFDDLPAGLLARFGQPEFVISLELSVERKLSRVEVKRVIESLEQDGFYLQLPPKLPVEEEIARRFS